MQKTTVAIVGRPNVGKSTLFNRIIRKREAIVDKTPGVTRDRIYASAEWAGVEFELIDTGGYVPTSDDIFEQAIRQQATFAIKTSNVVLFVTDVISGVTPMDMEIASMLQKAGHPTLLVVNKVDSENRDAGLVDFYSLGLGDPQPVSAIGGRMIGDMLDEVIKLLPLSAEGPKTEPVEIRIAVLGKPNVGKSSYVNAVLGEERHIVTEIPCTTRDAIDTRIRYQNREIVLIDTAGLRKRAKVWENIEYFSTVRAFNALRRCHVAIVLMDAAEGITDQDKKIVASAVKEGKGMVIGVNKWDLVEKDTMTARHFELQIQDEMPDAKYIPVIFISAVTKQRIFRLLDVAISVNEERKRLVQTSDLNELLEKAVIKNHPPAYGSKYVRLNYATQTKTAPPVFTVFTNEPKGIKDNYKNYLENQIRAQYGFLGVPIRLRFRKKN